MNYHQTDLEIAGIVVPPEFEDVSLVLLDGAKKHGANSFLEKGVFTEKRFKSQFRHLMKKTGLWSDSDIDMQLAAAIDVILNRLEQVKYDSRLRLDGDSGLPHELHEACNALMFYTVIERGILTDE